MTIRHGILSITIWIFAVLGATAVAMSAVLMLVPEARQTAIAELDKFTDGGAAPEPAADAHDGHAEEERHALALGDQALRNIGIEEGGGILKLALADYSKSVEFPATVTERPGRTSITVSSPVSGVIKRVYREPGVSILTGDILFDIELKHEDLISRQAEMLSLLVRKDKNAQNIARLENVEASLLPKPKRDLEFERLELEASLAAQRQVLQMYGVPLEKIIATIEGERKMIKSVTVSTPNICDHAIIDECCEKKHDPFVLFVILVLMGEQVTLGDPVCRIGDLARLYIEGEAFAQDELKLLTAVRDDLPIRAIFDAHDGESETVDDLKIRYIDSQISPENRTSRFFVDLPNRTIATKKTQEDAEFVTWRFKPGQRCRIEIPYETFEQCYVVPLSAVAFDGPETFVFQQSGTDAGRRRWMKRPVHIIHRGRGEAAIAADGSLYPGDVIAARGAGQLLLALTGGGGKLQSQCPCGEH